MIDWFSNNFIFLSSIDDKLIYFIIIKIKKVDIFFIIVLFFLTVPVIGQQPVIDSLENVLKNHPADDSSKLTILSNLSFYYSDIDPDLGFKYAEQEMQLAKKIKVPKHEAEALTNKALNHWAIGEYDTAIKTYRKAGEIYKQYHFERECIIVLGRLGVVY